MIEENIEKSLKRFLKRKVSVNESTVVKFLITGLIGATLTACGGGGGGGGSSSGGGGNSNVLFPEINNVDSLENFNNKTDTINFIKKLDNISSGSAVLKVSDNSNITLDSKSSIDVKGDTGVLGVVVTNSSNLVNNGYIKVSQRYINEGEIPNVDTDPLSSMINKLGFGILVANNSTGTNNGTIEVSGSSIGMGAIGKNSTAINNGKIILTGEISSNDKQFPPMGMACDLGGKIVNEKNGVITSNLNGSIGMYSQNGIAINNGTIKMTGQDVYGMNIGNCKAENNGTIIMSHNFSNDKYNNRAVDVCENSFFTNNGTIIVNNSYRNYSEGTINVDYGIVGYGENCAVINSKTGIINITGSSVGIAVKGNDTAINDGTINILAQPGFEFGDYEPMGMVSRDGAIVQNNNLINSNADHSVGMKTEHWNEKGEIINNGSIKMNGIEVRAMSGTGQLTNNNLIEITSNYTEEPYFSTGMYVEQDYNQASYEKNIGRNYGIINMNGSKIVGMHSYNGSIINNKEINLNGNKGTGMYFAGTSTGENNGIITLKGHDNEGMYAESNSKAYNKKIINVESEKSFGMTATSGGEVINDTNGTINVSGANSFGMKAEGFGSLAINKGTINVGANASGGMLATGGATISNEGTINIDKSHGLNNDNKKDFALQTQGEGSTIKNTGTINADREIKITTGTNYIIGTNSDGSYGKISAENISVDGNVKVSTEIAKGNYKESYILDDVVSGNTELKENYKLSSTSVLYNASSNLDEKGNLDAELSRNENNLTDFTSKEYDSLANIFDKGINDKEFRDKLSDEAKDVLNDVFANTTSKENIQNRLKEISGVEYTNIARQIFDTKDIFKSYDSSIINTLDDYQFNFNFIGNYSDVEAKGNLLGYDSKMTGISGAMKFNDSLYGVIGYGYNDIDFDGKSEGNIKSVHTGIYKDMKLNSFDVRMGVFGEYNFHEVERNITNEIAKGDFNSYLLGACGEISQKFGDSLYVKPALSLDVTYGRYEDFTEEGAKGYNLTVDSQDYTSIVPAVEVKVGKDFGMASIYSAVKFGYEFGDMNKVQEFAFDGLGKYHLDTDEIENAQTDVKVGTVFEFNNFTLNAEVGKDFGKRDREYITAGFTYTF